MESRTSSPFKLGDMAEVKSFESGYRGAWFRCKIMDIRMRGGYVEHALEFYDFPDEKLTWEKMYQVPPHAKRRHKELMIRPNYPPVFNRSQMHDASLIPPVAVIVDGKWKVGDLVDWWTDTSFWCGEITEILSDDKAQIQLLPEPLGEGTSYEALLKDIRPTLHWSPERGWEIPGQKDYGVEPCAWLIKPTNQVADQPLVTEAPGSHQQPKVAATPGGSSSSFPLANSAEAGSTRASDDRQFPRRKDSEEAATVSRESTSMTRTRVAEEGFDFCNPYNASREQERISLHSSHSDSVEAAVLDLQGCLNRVKRLRKILLNSLTSPPPPEPRWVFVPPSYPSDDDSDSPKQTTGS